jgi:lysozyme family protein
MANFTRYFQILRANEGGYCNRPGDTGGETYRGIARNSNPQWDGWTLVDDTKARLYPGGVVAADWDHLSLTLEADPAVGDRVLAFYKPLYWDTLSLDQVQSQSIADQVADHGVNSGVERAAMMVRYLLATEFGQDLAPEGALDAQVVALLNAVDQEHFYARFVAMRQAFYDYLADSFTPATAQVLAAWYQFFETDLKVGPSKERQQFLASWLSRTRAPFVA